MYEDRTVLAIPSSWVVRSPRKDLTGNHLEDGIVMYPPESWGKSDVDKAFSLERQPNSGWDELLVHYISPVLDNYAYARKLEMEASYCNDSDLETLVMSRLSAKRYRVPLKKKYPNELTSSSENEDAIKIADPPRIPQIKRKREDDDTQSASQPQKGTVMCQVKEIRPGCSPNLESKSKESQSRKYNSIPTFSRHLASSSSQEIRDVESASGSVLSVSNQVDGGFMPCSNCNAYKKDIAKVQAQLDEIVSILKVDVMGIKEQLDSLSVQVAGLKVVSSNNGETEDSLMFENEFQFPVCSLQDLKRVEEKLSSSLPFRKYLAKYVQDRASFPLLSNLSGKEQGFACNKAVNGMCAAIMTDDMVVLFNMKGRFGERLSFEENFPQVINVLLVATQSKVNAVNGHPVDMPAIKHSLSEWFRLAKTRTDVGKEKRREKARQKKGLPTQ